MPREGSFTLASIGSVRKLQETAFAVAFGRRSVAVKRILEAVFGSPGSAIRWSITCEAESGVRRRELT
jgi:hypothetical protein